MAHIPYTSDPRLLFEADLLCVLFRRKEFASLPTEIQIMIISFLDDASIFCSASLVSRTWRALIYTSKAANSWLWLARSRLYFPENSFVSLDDQLAMFAEYDAAVRRVNACRIIRFFLLILISFFPTRRCKRALIERGPFPFSRTRDGNLNQILTGSLPYWKSQLRHVCTSVSSLLLLLHFFFFFAYSASDLPNSDI